MTVTAAQFRDAMRRVAATVNVITIVEDGVSMGMTATAVSSLSADEPSLLVCVNQTASMHGALTTADHFCVNVMHRDQIEIAQTFSNSKLRDVRFATGGWRNDELGPPYLSDALASFVCERQQLIAFATHTICIGSVRQIRFRDDIDPLVYLDGSFVRVAR
jgi:flavin reductase